MTPEEMFYGTLPQDTQSFDRVLQGIGRNVREFGRAAQYVPYDILGAPVDIATLAMRPFGYRTENPVGGSDWLINLSRQMGIADKPTGSGAELAGRVAFGAVSPVAATKGLSQVGKFVDMIKTTPPVGSVNFTPQEVQAAQNAAQALIQPKRSDIGFYSQLEAATIPLQNKGTGQQFLAQIEKTAGVKPEEIKWTGLDTFLQGKKSVTKDEVLSYIDQNRVNLQEVRLGTPQALEARNQQIAQRYGYQAEFDNGEIAFFDPRLDDYVEFRDLPIEMRAEISNPQMQFGGTTKFSQYTLPGGENYREILLTLPQKKLTKEEAIKILGAPENAILTDADMYYASQKAGAEFRSSHFDQPNILAHMRVNDRVVDGKKTLFIEEIQSDWHQAGRKYGYSDPQAREQVAKEIKDKYGFTIDQNTSIAKLEKAGVDPETINKWHQFVLNDVERVPNAPFKTSWHELSLKRAIQEASEKGYDKIAFTTGQTQAARYDLSKQVNKIDVEAVGEVPNLYFVDVDVAGRGMMNLEVENGLVRQGEFAGKAVEDVVGKEIAEKVFAVERGRTSRLQGDDLRIGGEGMKGFYDNILPKSLEKLGKKFDAKVGKTTMDGVEVWSMDITPKMRESVTTKGQPLFQFAPAIPAGGLLGQEEE